MAGARCFGLYSIDLFQALSDEARALLLERFERIDLPPGAVLATEGQPGDSFMFILGAGEAQIAFDQSAADAPELSPDNMLEGAAEEPEAAVLRAGGRFRRHCAS